MTARSAEGGAVPVRWAGYATAVCAFLFALVSFYWGLGGTVGLDTLGREAVARVEAGDAGIFVAVWLAGVLKVGGGVLALALVRPWGRRLFGHRLLLVAGWGAAVVLLLYGCVQVGALLLVQTGVVAPPPDLDWRGFRGHLYLWDPWFVVWGVLAAFTAYHYTRDTRRLGRDRGA